MRWLTPSAGNTNAASKKQRPIMQDYKELYFQVQAENFELKRRLAALRKRTKENDLIVNGGYFPGEDIFHRFVPTAQKMSKNKLGYDFLTQNGIKLEVKFSLIRKNQTAKFFQWLKVNRQNVADRYILIGRDDEDELHFYDLSQKPVRENRFHGSVVMTPAKFSPTGRNTRRTSIKDLWLESSRITSKELTLRYN
jgi:hypothetical protein